MKYFGYNQDYCNVRLSRATWLWFLQDKISGAFVDFSYFSILYIADIPLGEEVVFPMFGENNTLSVATGLGVAMSSAGRVSTH